MLVITWNVRKHNAERFQKELMVNAVKKQIRLGEPWVLALLENVADGDEIGRTLVNELGGTHSLSISAGGNRNTAENVVIICGNCDSLTAEKYSGWEAEFNSRGGEIRDQAISMAKDKGADGARYSLRDNTVSKGVVQAQNAPQWGSENCRSPVIAQVKAGNQQYKLCFIHSPGPQACSTLSKEKYAMRYFSSVMTKLQHEGVDGVFGDFNIYGAIDSTAHEFVADVSVEAGGTTFSKLGALDTPGKSRLDRAFISRQYAGTSQAWAVNGTATLSDHLGLAVTLEKLTDAEDSIAQRVKRGRRHVPPAIYPAEDERLVSLAQGY